MTIIFSRHAKRRAQLYKISEDVVRKVLLETTFSDGRNEIIKNIAGLKYPIKIIAVVENNILTVITNYPLKKGRKK